MFGFGKRDDSQIKERFTKEILSDFGRVVSLLNAQVRPVVYFQQISKSTMLSDPYARAYIFGAFDGALAKWGLPIRQRLAPTMLELGVGGYLAHEFCLGKLTAQGVFQVVFDEHTANPIAPGFVEGGSDSLGMLSSGQLPGRLAEHYGYRGDDPVTEEEVAGFKRFFASQEKSPTP